MQSQTKDNCFQFPEAKWLWSEEFQDSETNAVFCFERTFTMDRKQIPNTYIAITADSRYRLYINDHWVFDGPSRGFTNHYFYDDANISSYLREGTNRIVAQVIWFGVDTFQSIRGKPGFIAAIYSPTSRSAPYIVSNAQWKSRRMVEYEQNAPRISCQLGFEENFDSRRISSVWRSAKLTNMESGQVLKRRPVPMLGKKNISFQRLIQIESVEALPVHWTFHVREIFSPFPRGANVHGMAGVMATSLCCKQRIAFRLYVVAQLQFLSLYIDGEAKVFSCDQDAGFVDINLEPGKHWLSIGICQEYDHLMEIGIGCDADLTALEWRNPMGDASCPWISTGPLWADHTDSQCHIKNDGISAIPSDAFGNLRDGLYRKVLELVACTTLRGFSAIGKDSVRTISERYIAASDVYFAIRTDRVRNKNISPVIRQKHFTGAMIIMESGTRVLLDLNDMTVGYFYTEFEAAEGATLDGYFFENLNEEDHENRRIQFTQNEGSSYRNSFRYIASAGHNSFLSLHRRGGRYLLLTFRNLVAPIQISQIGFVESTYPVTQQAAFQCSDERLNQIFKISQRTLLLCMEDTFTDCPTYEQTFWVGDARTEALVGCSTYGAYDLVEHGWRLVAQSLNSLPLAACQCPSGWDVIIPSFSFLWGIAVWEFYWQTGNRSFLDDIFPSIKKNLDTACRCCTDQGLFSVSAWNFFDWTPIDQDQRTVLHNSMLLAAALQSGAQIAHAIGDDENASTWEARREELKSAIHRLWDGENKVFRDGILSTGALSPHTCQHTSFLALLYDLIPEALRPDALQNCLQVHEGMTGVGSPNALCFMLEALRKEGELAQAMEMLTKWWGLMLDAGAKTFWEMFSQQDQAFSTRSHCHGWSSFPAYFLPKLLFGIECVEPGWRKVVLRPKSFGLEYAKAKVCTPLGYLKMEWTRNLDGSLHTNVEAPANMTIIVDSIYEH